MPTLVEFATKPQLAKTMVERAIVAQVPFTWVTGDSIYGGDRKFRLFLEEQGRSFVLGIASNEPLWSMTQQAPLQVRAQT